MSRFPTVPALDPGARLPALLGLLLGLGIIAQLVLGTGPLALPEVLGIARVARGSVPPVPPVSVPSALAARNLFVPPPLAGSTDTATPAPAPLGGAMVAGAIGVRGRRLALVMLADGHAVYVAPGGVVAGWRLAGIDAGGVRFRQGTQTITMAFGARAPAAPPPSEEGSEEESDQQ